MVPNFTVIGRPDPYLAWDGGGFHHHLASAARAHELEGSFAGPCWEVDGGISVIRDPLGLNKLFWADAGDHIEIASRLSLLTDRGHPLDACAAMPADTMVTYRNKKPPAVVPVASVAVPQSSPHPANWARLLDATAARIRETVSRYVGALLSVRPGPVVVCLSGGLDSTSVAAIVREHRHDAIAVTFDLPGPCRRHSDDYLAASQAARHLGLELLPSLHRPSAILDLLDITLTAGCDWRDFNVHAGLVNAALATTITDLVGQPLNTTVLTGDLVNEFLADYHPETYNGTTYYRLPRLPARKLRSVLVGGLQSANREIGVFGHFGLVVVQPYASARRHLLELPTALLGPGDGKRLLYERMFGNALPESVYQRPKTRAQTGSVNGRPGVLGVCVDAGVDARHLRRRFARLHHVTDERALDRFMRAGRHRTAIPGGDDATST